MVAFCFKTRRSINITNLFSFPYTICFFILFFAADPSRLSGIEQFSSSNFLSFAVSAAVTLFVHRSLTLFDWARSSSTVPPIAGAVSSRGRGRYAEIFKSRSNPAGLRFMTEWKVKCLLMSERLSCCCDGFCGSSEQEAGARDTCRLADGNLERNRRIFSNL